MNNDDNEIEILHLKGRLKQDGKIIDGELAYMSDHQIFGKMTIEGYSQGWRSYGLWKRIADVCAAAEKYSKGGWEITWHPAYQPLVKEFTKSVQFNN